MEKSKSLKDTMAQSGLKFGIECDNGWDTLIEDLHNKIVALCPDYTIMQIKEKFGGLRYYAGGFTQENAKAIYDLINEAEELSFKTCEVCGDEGKMAIRGGWLKTVCEAHLGDREWYTNQLDY